MGWPRKRQPYVPVKISTPDSSVPYAELHCHSNSSFLDGASHPEELVETAVSLGLSALALTDHDGMYGIVRFAEAAGAHGLPTIFGAELSLGLTQSQNGIADPEGAHLVVLARNPTGYASLCRAISMAQLAGRQKGKPVYDVDQLADLHAGNWLILTGCRKGSVPAVLMTSGPEAAQRELDELIARFGRDNVVVELWDHGMPFDSERNDALVELATRCGTETVATNNVHYATAQRWRLANALAAVRARRPLDEIDGWLPPSPAACLRSGDEQARRFTRWPGTVGRAEEFGRNCAFALELIAPKLPPFPVSSGHDEMSWLRELTEAGASNRYGPRGAERVEGAYAQIDHELSIIDELGYPGYFLIVWEIVQFCRDNEILCQGRGSAANSAVCYALDITAVDAVRFDLLFERFLSPAREGPPDIDVDIESGRREEVIQHVYARYGREYTAQVANVITYRARSALRDIGRAFGYSTRQVDAWSRQVADWGNGWGRLEIPDESKERVHGVNESSDPGHDIPPDVLTLASQLESFPRHLGVHSGGMVICDRPIIEICPIEWARKEGRTVLQWDKDDCAAVGLVKFDLLGLGMLTALHGTFDLLRKHSGVDLDMSNIPKEDPAVYEMLSKADSVGVFQVESRAQMGTLPRMRPRNFYDLVIEIALIRPGPIQGRSVHPYLRRRNGAEEIPDLGPLKSSLRKTLGIPLFQEQMLRIAIDAAGFTATQADELRQAMSSKRSSERMERLRARLYDGMAARGIEGEFADSIYEKLTAFSNFGFAESHAASFALLVYASAWLKRHHPAAFCASLLNAQPMGFWSPQSLVADARRHGVVVCRPDINQSGSSATLECQISPGDEPVVRLGLSSVSRISIDVADAIVVGQPYSDLEDLARRVTLDTRQFEMLAIVGAFEPFGLDRRAALWATGTAAHIRPDQFPGMTTGLDAPQLPDMSEVEQMQFDLSAGGISPDTFPTEFIREQLDDRGVVSVAGLSAVANRSRVKVGGIVTHRQRPSTANGTTFLNLEDETGLVNVICPPRVWMRQSRIAQSSPAVIVNGHLERVDGATNVIAHSFETLVVPAHTRSRDFR